MSSSSVAAGASIAAAGLALLAAACGGSSGSHAAQLGSTVPVRIRVGSTDVYLSAGTDQSIYTWFADDAFYVMSVRSDYPFPRTLLRKLVEAKILS